jgi:Domain of unknown function (DUF4263)
MGSSMCSRSSATTQYCSHLTIIMIITTGKPEIAQAISQIENYIDAVIRNAPEYIKTVKRRKHVDIKVVRPRGYIVAGSSAQFSSEKESDDFRKLGSSLKNISFVLYDDLLERLKNLRARL